MNERMHNEQYTGNVAHKMDAGRKWETMNQLEWSDHNLVTSLPSFAVAVQQD